MVFSLFGKKGGQPPKPEASKADKRPAAPVAPAAKKPPTTPAARGVDSFLDFSNFKPPPAGSPKAAVKPVPKPEVAKPVTAAAAPIAAPSAPAAEVAVAVAAAAAPAAKPAPASATPRPRVGDSIMSIEVTGSNEMTPAIEEAAILFANGQDQGALAALLKAVVEEDLGIAALQVWLMLFDLYQHMGMRKEFEEFAIDFAAKFERSPPHWQGREQDGVAAAALRTGGSSYVGFTELNAKSAAQVEQAKASVGKSMMLRLDFAKLQSIDAEGCRLLLEGLQHLKRAGKELMFSGEGQLIKLLEEAAKPEDKSVDQVKWLLLFELYQTFGLFERFDEAAFNYAITYEVSPPSFEAIPAAPTAKSAPGGADGGATDSTADQQAALRLSGEMIAIGEEVLKAITNYAAQVNPVVLDFAKVRRVDFVSAGQLLNALGRLRQSGKTVQIQGASEMVAALFGVMGIEAVANIVRRKS